MNFVYNLVTYIGQFLIFCAQPFSTKLKLFYRGRKGVLNRIAQFKRTHEIHLWIHVASLGEYEQGRPIIEGYKKLHPSHKILLSVFSPSAYEVIKGKTAADLMVYLPLDTPTNAKRFVAIAQPHKVVFIKYEIWPNYLKTLQKNNTPIYLIASNFRQNQIYFKWYGGFFKKALFRFRHIHTQDQKSIDLLEEVGYKKASIGGDTRFDRVLQIAHQTKKLDFLKTFKAADRCLVFGSSWPEDEAVYIPFINKASNGIKFIIAPHKIDRNHIKALQTAIEKKSVCYSEMNESDLSNYQVLIIDTIGLLTQIYAYADLAYIGGGFKTGLHNILEATTYGIPVLIGPNYQKFNEAIQLVEQEGVAVVTDAASFSNTTEEVLSHSALCATMAATNKNYTLQQGGATQKALDLIG